MPPAIIGGVIAGVGALGSAALSSSASKSAANQVAEGNAQAVAEQRRQFDLVQQLLAPYANAGNTGLEGLLTLTGARGAHAQQEAVSGIENQPLFQALVRQGEQGMLQNASATGGLRGGNIQGALAQFRPAMLNQQVQQQIGQFAGLASLGQNAAAGTGNAGMSTGNNISALLQNRGQAGAAGSMASANAWGQGISGIGSALGGLFNQSGSLGALTPSVNAAFAANPSIF